MGIKLGIDSYRHLFVWYLKISIPVNIAMNKNLYVNVISGFSIMHMDRFAMLEKKLGGGGLLRMLTNVLQMTVSCFLVMHLPHKDFAYKIKPFLLQ